MSSEKLLETAKSAKQNGEEAQAGTRKALAFIAENGSLIRNVPWKAGLPLGEHKQMLAKHMQRSNLMSREASQLTIGLKRIRERAHKKAVAIKIMEQRRVLFSRYDKAKEGALGREEGAQEGRRHQDHGAETGPL